MLTPGRPGLAVPPTRSDPSAPFVLRHATPADAECIAGVHSASREGVYGGRVPDAVLHHMSGEERVDRWAAWLEDPAIRTLVAEVDGEVVGFCTLRPSGDPDQDPAVVGELPTLYVHPDLWRRGIGKALCTATIELARTEGFQAVTLWVLALNAGARAFYFALGFVEDGTAKVDDGPTPAPYLAHRFRMDF